MIVARSDNQSDNEILAHAFRGEDVRFCESIEAACACVRAHNVRFLLCDVDAEFGAADGSVALRLRRASPDVPIVVRYHPTRTSAAELLELARCGLDVRDSRRDVDNLEGRVADRGAGYGATALFALLRAIGGVASTPPKLRRALAVYAIWCARVVNHSLVAAAAGRSASTLRAWFNDARRAGRPIPRYPLFNATIVALNVCWNREKLGMRPGVAARGAGFASTADLDRYLRWNLRATIPQLLDRGAPATLLAQIAVGLSTPLENGALSPAKNGTVAPEVSLDLS